MAVVCPVWGNIGFKCRLCPWKIFYLSRQSEPICGIIRIPVCDLTFFLVLSRELSVTKSQKDL